jgi:hypothetical protein
MSANVVPLLAGGGNGTVQTAATGANYTQLAAQRCSQVSIVNNSGAAVGVRQDGAGAEVPVFDQSYFTFYGLSDASQLSLRRVDQSNTQVSVAYRWEG